MNDVNVSKWLSYVLRHKPEDAGLKLDEQGWVGYRDLIKGSSAAGKKFDLEQLQRVVDTDNKKRYEMKPCYHHGWLIRASQGHSVKVDLGYTEQEPPRYLFHGTAKRFLDPIYKLGIIKGSRHQVHLSADYDTAMTVGARHGEPIVLMVMAKAMYDAGYKFYLSTNGVWLTEHVDPHFFTMFIQSEQK